MSQGERENQANPVPVAGQPPPAQTTNAPESVEAPRPGRRKLIVAALGIVAVGAIAWFGTQYVLVGRYIVSTDDAYVKADTTIIAAKVSGHIKDVPVLDNQHVERGDVLLTIDDGDYRLAEDAAREKTETQDATIRRIDEQDKAQVSAIKQAEAQIAAAQADLRRTQAAFERTATLAKGNISSPAALDIARAEKDRAQAALVSANAALDSVRAARAVFEAQRLEATRARAELITVLEKAKRDRSFTEIRAPFAGVVGNRVAQAGAYVQPGTRLMALVPLDSVYVEANFKETQLAPLKPGQVVTLRFDASASREIEGRLGSIAPASGAQFSLLPPDNATGNFSKVVQRVPVRVEIPASVAAEGWVRPGLSVIAEVHTNRTGADPHDRASR